MATTPHPSDPDIRLAGSQFIVTLGDSTDYLDGRASVFGKVVEGFDALEKINGAITDKEGQPLVDIRIKHTVVLDDPYADPAGLREPSSSPVPTKAQLATVRIADDVDLNEEVDEEAAAKKRREAEARAQALTLEMMGDLPFAEVKPPENILFVCKLNPVTQDEDLELIFSRFGKIMSCEVIRDKKTGDSLQYAFIEYEDKASSEAAYLKMQGVLIDDRRIHVDFSQSVSKLSDVWRSGENAKRSRKHGGGGWGGVEGLEKWRKYRTDKGDEDDRSGRYGMVYDRDEMRRRQESRGDGTNEQQDGEDSNLSRDSFQASRIQNDRRDGDRRDWDKESRQRSRSRSPRQDRYHNNKDRRGRDDRQWDDRPRARHDERGRRDRDRNGNRN